MSNLATLVVKIDADGKQLNDKIDKSKKKLKDLDTKATKTAPSKDAMGGFGGVGTLLAIGAAVKLAETISNISQKFAEMAKKQIEVTTADNKFARSVGDTTGNILEMRSAMEQVGGEAKDFDDAIMTLGQNTHKALYDAPLQHAFKQLNIEFSELSDKSKIDVGFNVEPFDKTEVTSKLPGEQFVDVGFKIENFNLSNKLPKDETVNVKIKSNVPTDTFIKVAEQISKIENSQTRANVATQIFGDKAAKIIPLLNKGAAGIAELRKEAVRLGQTANQIDANSLEEIERKYKGLESAADGFMKQLTLISGVSFLVFLEDLFGIDAELINITDVAKSMAKTITSSFIFIADSIDTAKLAWFGLVAGMAMGSKEITSALKTVADTYNKFADLTGKRRIEIDFAGHEEKLEKLIASSSDKIEAANKRITDRTTESYMKKIEAMSEKLAKPRKKIDDDTLRDATLKKDLFNKQRQWIESTLTPLEIFNNKLREMGEFFDENGKKSELFGRLSMKVLNEFADAIQDRQIQFAGAVKAGTTEAYSAVAYHQAKDEQYRETPEARIERLTQASLAIQKEQLIQQKRTADALSNRKDVRLN